MPLRFPRLNFLQLWNGFKPFLLDMGRPVLLTSFVLTSCILGIRQLGALQGMELAAYDRLIRLCPDEGEDPRILVVGITEADIQARQEWPMTDRTIGELLAKLSDDQPRAIGLDVFRDVPIGDDRSPLEQVFLAHQNIIAVCKANSAESFGVSPPPELPPEQVGFADLPVDPGGTLRRVLLWMQPSISEGGIAPDMVHLCNQPDTTIYSLSFQLARIYLQQEGIQGGLTPNNHLWLGNVVFPKISPDIGGYQGVDTAGYQLMLNYRSLDRAIPQVSLSDVLDGRVDPEMVRDRIVLIGYTTPESKDDFYTPYSAGQSDQQKMPGVVIHAQAVSQILSAVLNERPLIWAWSGGVEALWILGWSLVGGVIAWYVRHPLRFGGAIAICMVIQAGLSYGLFLQGGWIPLMPPVMATIITAGGVVLVDRFNKSEYGQTVYKQVRSFLKINIEIDQEKVERQVSEITQTEYFTELQQRAKNMRQRKTVKNEAAKLAQEETSAGEALNPTDGIDSNSNSNPEGTSNADLVAETTTDDDGNFLSTLQQRAQMMRSHHPRPLEDSGDVPEPTKPEDTAE
jgi:CHASE2 domain-containing sensor protein